MTTIPLPSKRRPAVLHARRTSGQVAAIASMIADERPFGDIVQQILAARASLDSLLVRLVELELHGCLSGREARLEVDALLRTALGHSTPARRGPSGMPPPSAAARHSNSNGGSAS